MPSDPLPSIATMPRASTSSAGESHEETSMKKSLGPGTWLYPTPVFVVGTYDAAGKANGMTVAWGGICCSKPPCVAISVRKATYTYGNLMDRKVFTISLPTQD